MFDNAVFFCYNSYEIEYGPLVKRSKTPPFHGGNRGSIPLWVTKKRVMLKALLIFYYLQGNRTLRGFLREENSPVDYF